MSAKKIITENFVFGGAVLTTAVTPALTYAVFDPNCKEKLKGCADKLRDCKKIYVITRQ